jgi:hypothetical protein
VLRYPLRVAMTCNSNTLGNSSDRTRRRSRIHARKDELEGLAGRWFQVLRSRAQACRGNRTRRRPPESGGTARFGGRFRGHEGQSVWDPARACTRQRQAFHPAPRTNPLARRLNVDPDRQEEAADVTRTHAGRRGGGPGRHNYSIGASAWPGLFAEFRALERRSAARGGGARAELRRRR